MGAVKTAAIEVKEKEFGLAPRLSRRPGEKLVLTERKGRGDLAGRATDRDGLLGKIFVLVFHLLVHATILNRRGPHTGLEAISWCWKKGVAGLNFRFSAPAGLAELGPSGRGRAEGGDWLSAHRPLLLQPFVDCIPAILLGPMIALQPI